MEALFQKITLGAAMPLLQAAFSGQTRFFWMYVLTGMAMAYFAYRWQGRTAEFRARLMDRETWIGTSARNDYLILFINPVIQIVLVSWAFANMGLVSGAIADGLRGLGVGRGAEAAASLWVAGALTLTLFVVDDFLRWFIHYLYHRVPVLWEFHKVHHSAEVLNFATANRLHPVEAISTALVITATVAAVNGVFIAFAGDKLTVATLAGANIVWVAFNVAGGALRHSPFWLSFGPRLERWFVSPAMHHIHHSDDPRHFDKNMGGSLAIWDRMAGTLHIPQRGEIAGFGIGPETAEYRSVGRLYLRPFAKAAHLLGFTSVDTA